MKTVIQILILSVLFSCSNNENSPPTTDLKLDSENYPDCFNNLDTTNLKRGFGCGSIFLFKEIDEGVLTINIDPNRVKLFSTCKTYELDNDIEVYLEVYPTEKIPEDSIRTIDFCGCVKISNAQKRINIRSTKGSFTAVVKPSQNEVLLGEKITAKLNNLEFKHPITGRIIKLDNVIFWDVNIGWFAG